MRNQPVHPVPALLATMVLAAGWLTAPVSAQPAISLSRLDPVAGQLLDSDPRYLGTVNGRQLASVQTPDLGRELWQVTPTSLSLIKDLNPGATGSGVGNNSEMFNAFGGAVFAAMDSEHGSELWFTDGSPAGTRLVKDLRPGAEGSSPRQFVALGDLVYFKARGQIGSGLQVWVTDGTAAGTSVVTDFTWESSFDTGVDRLAAVPGKSRLVFSVGWHNGVGEHSDQVMALEGDTLTTIKAGVHVNDYFTWIYPVGGYIYFVYAAYVPEGYVAGGATRYTRFELWRTDGTLAGTEQASIDDELTLLDLATPQLSLQGDPVFSANSVEHGWELWRLDSVSGVARELKDTNPQGAASGYPGSLVKIGDHIYFSAETTETGSELWVTDGTTEGTRLVADTVPGAASGGPFDFAPRAGLVYFIVYVDPEYQIWSLDPKVEGSAKAVAGIDGFYDIWDLRFAAGHMFFAGDKLVEGESSYNFWTTAFPGAKPVLKARPKPLAKPKSAGASWSAAVGSEDPVTAYRIRLYTKAKGGSAAKTVTLGSKARAHYFTKLKAKTRYWVTVTPIAYTAVGPESARILVSTK